ncbi:MAG: response regulator transcription factor [Candidatus Aquicultor sp.]
MKTASVITQDITLKEKLLIDLATLGYRVMPATTEGSDIIILDYRDLEKLIENNLSRIVLVIINDAGSEYDALLSRVDDVLIYPYEVSELSLRLRLALMRRGNYESATAATSSDNILALDGMIINFDSYEVAIDGLPLDLTFKEYELLRCLITNRGRVYTRDQLLSNVWGYDYYGGARTVDVHIRRLRAKLGRHESLIETVRNVGYRFKK